jgi:hypothetical protein
LHRFLTRRIFARLAIAGIVSGLTAVALNARADAIIYAGGPNLALTSAVIAAGGGPANFSSYKLFHVVAGAGSDAVESNLTKQFGANDVKITFELLDYSIEDIIGIVSAKHVTLPPPSPSPGDAKALARSLYAAGVTTTGKWDVGYMIERLVTHPVHHVVMHDIDAKFGPKNNATMHIVLDELMHEVEVEYGSASR